MRVQGRRTGTVLSLLLLLGCKPKAVDHPEESGLELDTITLPGDGKELRWLGGDSPATLKLLFNQAMKGTMLQASTCPQDPTVWAGLSDSLVVTHNTLSVPAQITREEGSKTWISLPEVTPTTRVSYSRNSRSGSATVGAEYLSAVNVDAGFDKSQEDLSLIIADLWKTVELEGAARDCIIQNLCSENSKSGEYVDAVYYGSMLRLYVDAKSYSISGGASGGVSGVKVHFSAGLKSDSLQLRGGLVGSFAGDQVGKFINMEAVLRALEKRDIIEIQKIMRSASTLGVIAVRTVSYSEADCKRLAAPTGEEKEGQP